MIYIKYRNTREKTRTIYLFTESQFNLMLINYELGGCSVTEKGLIRYSVAHLTDGRRLFQKCQPTRYEQREYYRGCAKLFNLMDEWRKS